MLYCRRMATETQLIYRHSSRNGIYPGCRNLFWHRSRCLEIIGLGLALAWLLATLGALGCPSPCRGAPGSTFGLQARIARENLVSLRDPFSSSPQAHALPEPLHCLLHHGSCQLVLPLFPFALALLIIILLQTTHCLLHSRLGLAPIPPPPRLVHTSFWISLPPSPVGLMK